MAAGERVKGWEEKPGEGAGDGDDSYVPTMIIIGAGQRGKTYARFALEEPDRLRVVAVAEPRVFHRELMGRLHGLSSEMQFSDWREVASRPRFADAVCIATQDSMHAEPALAFAELGYHILLEKPMAVTEAECIAIVEAVRRAGVLFAVGHVMRYMPYTRKMRALVEEGAIGDIVNVQHLEPIGHWHFAHSYVRGSWRREEEGTFMLMAKCCHDIDWLRYIVGAKCEAVSSFGSLHLFRPERAPEGAADRCLDCALADECPYSATKIYLKPAANGHSGWPASGIVEGEVTEESVEHALRDDPYGRCVWRCDNDVCDHQVVAMQFQGGVSATLTTTAFTEAVCRRHTRIFGTLGEIEGDGETEIRVRDFTNNSTTTHHCSTAPERTLLRGHGGADYHLIASFADALKTNDHTHIHSGLSDTLESHLIVFAAEHARREKQVVHVAEYADAAYTHALELEKTASSSSATQTTPSSSSSSSSSSSYSHSSSHSPPHTTTTTPSSSTAAAAAAAAAAAVSSSSSSPSSSSPTSSLPDPAAPAL